MMHTPRGSTVRSISDSSRPTSLAMPPQDLVLALHAFETATDVAGIGVAGDDPQGLLLAAAADQDRQTRLDRRRQLQDLVRA